ncbi:hypothetical protein MTO96_027894 [Rhipicephalus appendiculatus]
MRKENLTLMVIVLFSRQIFRGSDGEDCLRLEEVKIGNTVVAWNLQNVRTGSHSVATMHDVYVLFGVLLCNMNCKEGTIFDRDWFQGRVNDLVALFPAVSNPPPVPLYSESQADALSALRKQSFYTAAHIVWTIVGGRFQGPLKRLQEYVCEQWGILAIIGAETQLSKSATSEHPVLQEAEQISRPSKSLFSAPQQQAISKTLLAQQPGQGASSNPAVEEQRQEDVTIIATTMPQSWDAGRFVPTRMASQKMYVFPPRGEFTPNWIRLVTRSRDPGTAVPCLLGFVELVCGTYFQEVLNSADKDGVLLEQVTVNSVEQLQDFTSESGPAATMDDFYVLLGMLLCNLSCPHGSDMNHSWFKNRAKELVLLFPNISGEVPARLYDNAQADAVCAFGDQRPHTRAAICSIILKGRFMGPMRRLQQYVSEYWNFAGIEHVARILEFLIIRHPCVVDAIPELKCKDHFLQELLRAYKTLGADAPYMKLLHLPEAATALPERLCMHATAAYALAVAGETGVSTQVKNSLLQLSGNMFS